MPGRYLLVTREGLVAPLEVRAERATVEVGSARLVVRTTPKRRLQVVPADADAFARLVAARASVSANDSGEAVFQLAPGRYALLDASGPVLAEIEVAPGSTSFDLP